MKKRFFIMMTVIFLLLLSGCSRDSIQIFNDIKGEPYANAGQYTAGNFTYAPSDVDAIELCWRVGDIELIESDTDTLSVNESGTDLDLDTQMYHYLDGRTLRIQFCRSGANVHVNSEDKNLTLEIPRDIELSVYNTAADIHAEALEQKSVFISSHSGTLKCGTIVADSVNLSSSSGDIQVDQVTGNNMEVATSSGKMELENTVLSGSLDITSTSGEVTMGELSAGEFAVSTTSGGVNIGWLKCSRTDLNTTSGSLCLPLPENGAKVTFSSRSGRISTDCPYKTVGDLLVFGDGECEIYAVTTSGNLQIG